MPHRGSGDLGGPAQPGACADEACGNEAPNSSNSSQEMMNYEEEAEVAEIEARSDTSDIDLNSTSGSGSDETGSGKEKKANWSTSNNEPSSSSSGSLRSDSDSPSRDNLRGDSRHMSDPYPPRAKILHAQFQPHPHLRGVHLDSNSMYSAGAPYLHAGPAINSSAQIPISSILNSGTSSLQGGPISLYASQHAVGMPNGSILLPATEIRPLHGRSHTNHTRHPPFHKVAALRTVYSNAQQQPASSNLSSATNQPSPITASLASSSSQLAHRQNTLHHHLHHRQYFNNIKDHSRQAAPMLMASYADCTRATFPNPTRHNHHLDTQLHQTRLRSRSDSQSTLIRSHRSTSMDSVMDFPPDAILMLPPPPYVLQENGNANAVAQQGENALPFAQSGLQSFVGPMDPNVMTPFQLFNHFGVPKTCSPHLFNLPSPDPSSDSNTSTLIGYPPVIVTPDGQLNPALAALIEDAKRSLRRMNRQRKKLQRSASWSGECCRDLSDGGGSSGSGGSGSENSGEERGRKLTVQYHQPME
ncbi:hypothetical protein BC830DRAFT_21667 [Chytriomyces sp. MP71]|nr:hypothetical protein BC830DRAFT_21667 [Chytriomyces sp. MP71]